VSCSIINIQILIQFEGHSCVGRDIMKSLGVLIKADKILLLRGLTPNLRYYYNAFIIYIIYITY